jgi:hypothetical protein
VVVILDGAEVAVLRGGEEVFMVVSGLVKFGLVVDLSWDPFGGCFCVVVVVVYVVEGQWWICKAGGGGRKLLCVAVLFPPLILFYYGDKRILLVTSYCLFMV